MYDVKEKKKIDLEWMTLFSVAMQLWQFEIEVYIRQHDKKNLIHRSINDFEIDNFKLKLDARFMNVVETFIDIIRAHWNMF